MFASTGNSGRNGVKRVRLDPLNPSNQQNGSRKSLLERLNSAGQEKSSATASLCPEKPRYIDVTAAFFGKQRRPPQESKGQMLPPSPRPPRPAKQQQPSRPCRPDVQNHDKQRRPAGNESPVAKELRDELAGTSVFFFLQACLPRSIQHQPNSHRLVEQEVSRLSPAISTTAGSLNSETCTKL